MKGVSSSSFRGVCCPIHSSFSVFKKRRSFCSCDRKICPPPPPPALPSRSKPSLVWKGEEERRYRPSFDQRILVSVGEPAHGFLSFFLLEFFYSFRQNYSQTLAVLWKMQLKQPVCSIKFDFSPLFSSFEKPSYSTPLQILGEKRGDRAGPGRRIRKGGIGEDRIPARPGQLNPICLRSRKFKRAEIPPPSSSGVSFQKKPFWLLSVRERRCPKILLPTPFPKRDPILKTTFAI